MKYPTLPLGFHWAPLGGSWHVVLFLASMVLNVGCFLMDSTWFFKVTLPLHQVT